ncbi:hypothetical protein [Bacillus sp. FJAT-22090]|uniref:hypothetical protein n=1 Tax=Bacillus sp. FJAT-22090 TaxID=1581038 RepID=UPI0011A6CCB9|nr:hypothetical protein [Bacillus sp. FJAT-22090]
MNMSTWAVAIIPLIILLFLIWLFLRFGRKATKHINWTKRANKWIVYIYVSVLLLAVIAYVFIPTKGNEIVTPKEYTKLKKENEVFQQAFGNKEESKLDPKFLVKEWTQQLKGDTLEIISKGSNFPSEMMSIEWTDSKEQLVDIKMYRTYSYMDGLNLDGEIPLSTIEMKDDQIILTAPPLAELTYYRFSNELASISMMESMDDWKQRGILGNTYIYLKVPKNINVIDKDGLQFY